MFAEKLLRCMIRVMTNRSDRALPNLNFCWGFELVRRIRREAAEIIRASRDDKPVQQAEYRTAA